MQPPNYTLSRSSFPLQPETPCLSIAVLPFANMSGDATQNLLRRMTEEITSALAKVPNLRVVARTSAFQFKSQNRDIQSIGQRCTRRISSRVRCGRRKPGAHHRQLIKAEDGTHLWRKLQRELRAVFAVQEEIAQHCSSLQMPLGLKQGEHLVPNRSIDPDSYQKFLRTKAMVPPRDSHRHECGWLIRAGRGPQPQLCTAWRCLDLLMRRSNFHRPLQRRRTELRRVVGSLSRKPKRRQNVR